MLTTQRGNKMNDLIINGKKRYKKITEEEAKKWDSQASRLKESIRIADVSGADIIRKCELKGCNISKSNFSNYCNGQRDIAKDHIDSITDVLIEDLSAKGIVRNPILFKDYIQGNLPFIDSYEEYEVYINDRPEECFTQYSKFFAYAGMILGYDNGITIWTRKSNIDEKTNRIKDISSTKIEKDDPEYSLYYNGKIRYFSVPEMKSFYESMIKHIQEQFNDVKEGDSL